MRARVPVHLSRAAGWARLVGGLAVPVLVLGALGARAGLVPGPALVSVLLVGFVLGLIAVGLAAYALTDIWRSGAEGAGAAFAGILYALPVLVLLGGVSAAALIFPRLNDVSTDLADPPGLEDSAAAAVDETAGERVTLQSEAYPDLAPRIYALPIATVHAAALKLAEERGWEIVADTPPPSSALEAEAAASPAPAQDPAVVRALGTKRVAARSRSEGVIETPTAAREAESHQPETATLHAVARTPLFGFADDVLVRLRPEGSRTRLDMRSVSRTGLHDLGQNARRIRSFLADLDAALQPSLTAPPPPAPVESPPLPPDERGSASQ